MMLASTYGLKSLIKQTRKIKIKPVVNGKWEIFYKTLRAIQRHRISNKIMKDMYAKLRQSTVTYYSARGAEIHETREVDGTNHPPLS
jgi:hypothetical protein